MERAMDKTTLQFLFVMILVLRFCQADIRLVGGATNAEGRVEVFYDGQWGTICDRYWDLNDANVVCRSLGLQRAVAAPRYAPFGRGIRPIWMARVQCLGTESSLDDCPHRGHPWPTTQFCQDASVVCETPLIYLNITNITGVISSPGYPRDMEQAYYQWTFVPAIPRARIALYFEDIALYRWNGETNLTVLDGSNNQLLTVRSKHDPVSIVVKTTTAKVIYYSSSTVRGVLHRGFRMRYYAFSKFENDQLCSNWNMTFTQINAGRINVSWSHVAQPSPMPGSTYAFLILYKIVESSDYTNFTFVELGSRTARMNFLHPNTTISIRMVGYDASSAGNNTVMHTSCPQLVKTLGGNIRLVGGANEINNTEGRVEVFHNGAWGTICHYRWDLNDANVVCRSLGLPKAVAAPRHAAFGRGTGPIWMANLYCRGNESSLFQCPYGRNARLNLHLACTHSRDASVICGRPPLIYLNVTSLHGVISSPWFPYYMEQAYYQWTFVPAIPRARIALYFEHVLLYHSGWNVYLVTQNERVRVTSADKDKGEGENL